MKIFRSKLGGLILGVVIIIFLGSCGARSSHCYLCQGIPHKAPCLVDLSTGDVAPLTVNRHNDAISFQVQGNARIEHRPGETCAIIPIRPREANTDLFCENCKELIENTPNIGYVLADMSAPDHVSIYSIEAGATSTIRGYDISIVTEGDRIKVMLTVQQ